MSYWACAQLESNRERLALHCLELGGYSTYLPRIRERRRVNGRQVFTVTPPVVSRATPSCLIELQWHAARWCPGILRLVLDGAQPARVPDKVIADLRKRERNGLIELPPPPDFQRGDCVRITWGGSSGQRGLYAGQRPHERVAVLLQLLGRDLCPRATCQCACVGVIVAAPNAARIARRSRM